MAGRIQEDAEVLPRLVLSLACSDGKDLCLGLIEIFDVEVEVRLLGPVGAGPDGWLVVRCPLEGQSGSRVAAKLDPVPTVIVQVEAGELGIELRQRPRVRAIEGYQAEPCDPVHVVASPSRCKEREESATLVGREATTGTRPRFHHRDGAGPSQHPSARSSSLSGSRSSLTSREILVRWGGPGIALSLPDSPSARQSWPRTAR